MQCGVSLLFAFCKLKQSGRYYGTGTEKCQYQSLRNREEEALANPLRKQYYDRRDDSDKLKQMIEPEEETL